MLGNRMRAGERRAFFLVVLILAVVLLVRVGQAMTRWDGVDMDVYRQAATAWVDKGNPYAAAGDSGMSTYRYAAWFAALWIPFRYIPRELVLLVWSLVLMGAIAAIVVSLLRTYGERALPLSLLGAALLTSTSAGGNVQPLMVALLYFGIHRSSGPVVVGVAASLKLVPILFVLPWMGRGEWRKVIIALSTASVLLAPTLLFNLPDTMTDPGAGNYPDLAIWLALALAGLIGAAACARGRYAWIAAGAAAILALPRLLSVDMSIILPAAARRPTAEAVRAGMEHVG